MKILAIDTATSACSVALLNGSESIQEIEIKPNEHSKLVLSMVSKVLDTSGFSLKELDAIAVDSGPGSFTGVRIGLGVAQGLAYANDLPVFGISSLMALAESAGAGIILPAIDARMNQVYCSMYEVKGIDIPIQKYQPVVVNPDSITFKSNAPIQGLGSGWDVYSDQMIAGLEQSEITWMKSRSPEATHIGSVAIKMGINSALNPMDLVACYVRNDIAQKSIK